LLRIVRFVEVASPKLLEAWAAMRWTATCMFLHTNRGSGDAVTKREFRDVPLVRPAHRERDLGVRSAGKPVIRGTRIPVSVLISQLAEGASWAEVLKNYPELKREDIHAALEYASAIVENTDTIESVAA